MNIRFAIPKKEIVEKKDIAKQDFLSLEKLEEIESKKQEREYSDNVEKIALTLINDSEFTFREIIRDNDNNAYSVPGKIPELDMHYNNANEISIVILARLFTNDIIPVRDTGRYVITLENHVAKREVLPLNVENAADLFISNPTCDLRKFILEKKMSGPFYLQGRVDNLNDTQRYYTDISSRCFEETTLGEERPLKEAADYISRVYHWLNARLPIK